MVKRPIIPATSAVLAMLLLTAAAAAQSRSAEELGVGKLLVSSKGLPDPNFDKTVVLLIQYDDHGSLGLMINRRTDVTLSKLLEGVDTAKHASDAVFEGGPVEMQTVFALLKAQKKPDDATSILSDVYLVNTKPPLQKALSDGSGSGDVRVYVGYCGWGPGQLENEMRLGGWWIFRGAAGTVFDPNPTSLWSRLILRTEQQIAQARIMPASVGDLIAGRHL
jgi:putative transcriptional regulator